jgi:histidyl-tRNA synthetase
MAADAEMCAAMADIMETLGLKRGDYVVRVNNRKILNGVLDTIGLLNTDDPEAERRRGIILRAVDKLDRLGPEGVRLLLGPGRKDESGDFTAGAGLSDVEAGRILAFTQAAEGADSRGAVIANLAKLVGDSTVGAEGVAELTEIDTLLDAAGFGADRVAFDPSVVRGLGYYTGPVFEIELTFEITNEEGERVRFGSVGGGGRYDDLVARFKGTEVPATGMSIGVDRLMAALRAKGLIETDESLQAPVTVLMLDKDRKTDYQAMVFELRRAGIRAELYVGGSGMRAQVKYADKRGAPVAVIQGEDEAAEGKVTLKDLILGARMSEDIADNRQWREDQPAQISVPREDMVAAVRDILSRYA